MGRQRRRALDDVDDLAMPVLAVLAVLAVPAILRGGVSRRLVEPTAIGLVVLVALFAIGAVLIAYDAPLAWVGRVVQRVRNRLRRGAEPSRRLPERLLRERGRIVGTLGPRWKRALAATCGRWAFDYATLLAALAAVGSEPRPGLVLLAFCTAQVLAQIPITPGGLGFVEDAGVPGRPRSDDAFGSGLASGDFDRDGSADLAIGTPGRGRVSVLYGSASGLNGGRRTQLNGSAQKLPSGAGQYGYLLLARDVDGDRYDDLLVGAPGEDSERGAVQLLLGGAGGLRATRSRLLARPAAATAGFGTRVRTGDVNGDHRKSARRARPRLEDQIRREELVLFARIEQALPEAVLTTFRAAVVQAGGRDLTEQLGVCRGLAAPSADRYARPRAHVKGDGESAPGGTSAVRVRLLGGFALAVDGRPVAEGTWRLRKARTLVKLLALAPGQRLHREQVIELLWPDRAPAAAANNLHQALHVARGQLGGRSDRRWLRLEDDTLALGGEIAPWIDVEAFRSEGGVALRSGDPGHARSALELYRGPLLPEDLYEEWTEPHRAELEALRQRLLALAGLEGVVDAAVQRRLDNLPVELTMFIGREAAVTEVVRLLRRGALVTLSGPAGAGKTRLALEVAARRREQFRDGVWFVDLAPLAREELIADAIADATGLTHSGRSPSAVALVDWLAGRELLIVLDNCEHLIAGCAETVEQVLRGCPAVQVLATSREPLALTGELVWRVPSLTLPDATRSGSAAELLGSESVRLFVERARAVQPRFALTEANAGDVAGICRRLDGMPLAIELAAARAGSLPPAEIGRRLVASFGLLRHQRRTFQTRQQTLEAALDWSYRLLEAPEARLLGRLGVFAGPFGLDAAEQICSDRDLPREEIVDLLAHLVDKSLVVASEDAGEPRYRLLEMIRQYARERLAEQEEPAALPERHARWYAELAQDPGVTTAGAEARRLRLRRLDRDQADVRGALGWVLDHDTAAALGLATALGDWWLLRGRFAEGQEWLLGAVARTPPSTRAAAAALLHAAPLALRGGDPDGGNRLAERSAEIYDALGDYGGVAAALHLRASHDWLRGRFADAREWLEQAIAAARLASLPGPEANATHGLAIVELAARRLARARALLEQTLALLARAPQDAPPDFLVVNLGHVPVLDGDGHVQRLVQEESQNTFRRVDPPRAGAYARANLALVARLQGRPDEAEAVLGDALAQLRAVDDEAGIAQLLAATGRLATLQGELDRARAALRESLAIRRRLGDVRSVSLSLALLAELAAAEGDGARQRALLERALAMVEEVGDRPATTWTLLALAQAERAAGHAERARPRLEAALALSEALGSRLLRGWALVDLSELERGRGAGALAARLLDEARDAFAGAGDPWGLERCELLAAERTATLSER